MKGGKREGAGRPIGARQKLGESFLTDLAEFWRSNKEVAFQDALKDDPMKFVQMIADLLPKEAKLDVSGTVTHQSEPISELDGLLANAVTARQTRKDTEPLPN